MKIDTPLLETFFPTSDVIFMHIQNYQRSRGCAGTKLEARDFIDLDFGDDVIDLNQGQTGIFKFI